jgi:hypothetical protein
MRFAAVREYHSRFSALGQSAFILMGSQITMDDVKHHLLDIAVLYLFIEKTDCFCSFFVGTKFAPGFPDWTLIIYFVAKFSEISGVIRGLVSEVISLVFLRKYFEV